MMETDTLRLFVLAADKLNISAAGRELGLAPSVASAWMSKLEKSVGADLLHRSTRKVALSTEGLEFLPYARDIIAREDAARAALGQGKAQVSGTLRFTAPSTFAQLYIAPTRSCGQNRASSMWCARLQMAKAAPSSTRRSAKTPCRTRWIVCV